MRILIVGGYGTFGGRLARLLLDLPITIVIAGRALDQAQSFCASYRGRAELVAAQFDRNGNIPAQLDALSPALLVDASGPFQAYGERPYRLIEACIERGIHYLDLADGAEFVAGVSALDARAQARGVVVLSGVSSFPVLTAAVVRRLIEGSEDPPECVAAGIAPSPQARVGFNVIQAIAGYAGEPVQLWRGAQVTEARGLLEQRWRVIAPPGTPPLAMRMFSLVDVPDLLALPKLWPSLREVWVGAAPVPLVFHRMLVVLARLHRYRLFPSIARLASLMYFVTQHLSWGEHRGGMFVTIQTRNAAGARETKTWSLIAEGDSGPFIPSMAAECIIRKHLGGERIAPGARNAIHDIALSDYEGLFSRHDIVTGIRAQPNLNAPLFERALGALWDRLPPQVRAIHALGSGRSASGVASVVRGKGLLSRLVAALMGLPSEGTDVPLTVRFTQSRGRERWTRRFGDKEFHSEMSAGSGREEGLLIERFGPCSVGLALVWETPRLKFIVRRCRLGPISLPRWLSPTSDTYETAEEGRFHFDVTIAHPLLGLLVRYRGWLEPNG
jgi:hypothetical protein